MPILPLEEIRELAVGVLTASKTSPENAAIIAAALAAAEADGLSSHGASRLPSYADQAISGKVNGFAVPALEQTAAAAVRVDARDGFAFPAIAMGLERAAEIIDHTGIVGVAVGNSHHFGVAGYHVERLAEKGLVGIAFGNSPAGIAPWGGSRPLFGTNPIAFACPRADASPLVTDLSLSKVARGKLMVAARTDQPIPEGWALDPQGNPTTDAKAGLAGTMIPMGDVKGAVLALMVEIIAAALTGSHFGYEASSFLSADGPPPRVGQFFLILEPDRFAGDGFVGRVEELLAAILEQPGTRLPGYLDIRAESVRSGVNLADELHAELVERASKTKEWK